MQLDAYIRVSQVAGREGESFISPELQREQIAHWLRSNGGTIGTLFEELDESGGRPDRPYLEEALARVEAGESDGIIVAKLDRFGRSVRHGLAAIERIEQAGGVFVSVQEGVDMSTPAGRLMIRIMLSFGEWELERSRESWRVARVKAIERGQYLGSVDPYGYRKGPDGRLRLDPIEAPVIAEVFRLRGQGVPNSEVAAYLNASPLQTHTGVPFETEAVWRIVKSRVYLGEIASNGATNPTAHAAIVDPATWQRAKNPHPGVRPNTVFVLSGLIRCAACGYSMPGHLEHTKLSSNLIYRCNRGPCPDRASAKAEELEPLVEQWVTTMLRGDWRTTRWIQPPIGKRRKTIRSCLDILYVEPGIEPIAQRVWVVGDGSGPPRSGPSAPFNGDPGADRRLQALKGWPEHELAAALEEFLRGLESWPDFEVFSRAGQSQLHAQAMRWGGVYHWAPRFGLQIPRVRNRFDPRLLEGALTPFLQGRSEWPTREEFEAAGLGKVGAAVVHHGGAAHWARRFGLSFKETKLKWTRERIEGELSAFTKGRTTFPTQPEFARANRGHLLGAVRNHGGIHWWADRLELRLINGRARPKNRRRLEAEDQR